MTTGANGQKACILRTDEKHDAIWHHGLERVKLLFCDSYLAVINMK